MAREDIPSIDAWLSEAKALRKAGEIGMYVIHNGVVRATAKREARFHTPCAEVTGMALMHDAGKVAAAKARAEVMPGIKLVRLWINDGELAVGDDIMYVLIGGDIRPNVIAALESLVDELKNECLTEKELFAPKY